MSAKCACEVRPILADHGRWRTATSVARTGCSGSKAARRSFPFCTFRAEMRHDVGRRLGRDHRHVYRLPAGPSGLEPDSRLATSAGRRPRDPAGLGAAVRRCDATGQGGVLP